jgi:hypothetical protein
MTMSEVTDLLAQLRAGSISLEEVADRFRHRAWPGRPAPPSRTAGEALAAEERDPEPPVEGSFQEVHAAYIRHELTDEQYAVLADAVSRTGRDA